VIIDRLSPDRVTKIIIGIGSRNPRRPLPSTTRPQLLGECVCGARTQVPMEVVRATGGITPEKI